ncbi:hypothetical protein FACS1894110_20890 [Spirochaetia bacterium]|nr:hypothetical protein FACS1894110_20890 [Spirochaetia bacterium]
MKRILTVLLLFVSFSLFAEKREIGRLHWVFNDYGKDYSEYISPQYRSDSWGEYIMTFTSTVPEELTRLILPNSESPEGYAIRDYTNSFETVMGHIVLKRDTHSITLQEGYNRARGRMHDIGKYLNPAHQYGVEKFANALIGIMNSKYTIDQGISLEGLPVNQVLKKYSWESITDFDNEEFYWTQGLRDEKGNIYYEFEITFIVYEEI